MNSIEGYYALYFSTGDESGRGIVSGSNASYYVPAYAAIWVRSATTTSDVMEVVLDATLETFNGTQFQVAVAETARTCKPLAQFH